ncbi:MAG: serine/threonine protein kinase, partial [Chloroflexi bacterium]|nr:serine/threonine protein kinase [Chloroflexota bacterium]
MGTDGAGGQSGGQVRRMGPYVLREPLGRGGFAIVYRGYDPKLDRDVAVKVIIGQNTDNEYFAQSFEREARSVGRLRHPNIMTVYFYGDENGVPFLAMELIEGGSLKDDPNKPMDPEEVGRCIAQIASALDYAHSLDYVHRDIKPNNILVDRHPGQPTRYVLADFGLAKVLAEARDAITI